MSMRKIPFLLDLYLFINPNEEKTQIALNSKGPVVCIKIHYLVASKLIICRKRATGPNIFETQLCAEQ